MKRKPDPNNLEPQKFAKDETVRILRPNIWFGCTGIVELFANGLHRVKIEAKDGEAYPSGFHADVTASELESFI